MYCYSDVVRHQLVGDAYAPLLRTITIAAKNIASEVISHTVSRIGGRSDDGAQEGSGGMMVLSRRLRKRPPGQRVKERRSKKEKISREK